MVTTDGRRGCAAPECDGEPCARVRVGPMFDPLVRQAFGQYLDDTRCVRMDLCPDHVGAFVDVSQMIVAGIPTDVRLWWDR